MKVTEAITAYKEKHKNTFEHEFRNGTIFRGGCGIKLYEWMDSLYQDAVKEFKTTGTKKNVEFIKSLIE